MALPNPVQHFQPFPLKVFFNSLDVTPVIAWTLHKDVTGNKINRQNFIVRLAHEHRQNYVIRNRSATVPERGAPSPSSNVDSAKMLNVVKIKINTLAFYAKKKTPVFGACAHKMEKKILLCTLYFRRAVIIVKCFEIIKH